MHLRDLMRDYKPGSADWGWADEFQDIRRWEWFELVHLIDSVRENGVLEPVLLGDDGRVWDGHHRILAAWEAMIEDVPAYAPDGGLV